MVPDSLSADETTPPTVAVREVVALPEDLTTIPPSEWMTDGVRLNRSVAPAPLGRIALIVVHGMGQQSHFDTMSGAADGLRSALHELRQAGNPSVKLVIDGPARAQAGIVGNDRIEFLSFDLHQPDDATMLAQLHVYESYWAPLTEGIVTLNDVVSFLLMLLFGAVMYASTRFRRNAILRAVPLALFPVTLIALVLGAAFGLLITFAGDRCATAGASIRFCGSPPYALVNDSLPAVLRAALLAVFVAPVTLFVVAFLLETPTRLIRSLYTRVEPERRGNSYAVTRGLTFVSVLAMIGGCIYAFVLASGGEAASGSQVALPSVDLPDWYVTVIWLVLIALSLGIRSILVQYVGDVVTYVSSHSLDRFHATRQKVRDTVYQSLRCLYAMKVDGRPVYDSVMIAGHSLGSLAAYDALNRLIAEDEAARGDDARCLRVVDRTPLLLTFGSPLDKAAFIFAQQAREATRTRAALAATTQPMLMKPGLRPARWVNVWSPWDIISGPLEFFDPPLDSGAGADRVDGRRIENYQDERAATILYAHVEYWKNSRIYSYVLEEVGKFLEGSRARSSNAG